MKSIDSVLGYQAVAGDYIMLDDPLRICAVFEIHISNSDSSETHQAIHDRLLEVLISVLPDYTQISFYLSKIFRNSDIKFTDKTNIPIVQFIDDTYSSLLNDIASPEYRCYMSITVPLIEEKEDFSLLDKLLNKNASVETDSSAFENLKESLDLAIQSISSAVPGIYRLESRQIIQFLSLLINHDFLDIYSDISTVFNTDFNSTFGALTRPSEGGYVYYGGRYNAVYSQRANKPTSKLPEQMNASWSDIFYHAHLAPYDFTVQHSIFLIPKSEGKRKANVRRNLSMAPAKAIAALSAFSPSTEEGFPVAILNQLITDAITIVESSNHRFIEQFFHVHVWGNTLEELEIKGRRITAIIHDRFKLFREKYAIRSAYFSLFPGCESMNCIKLMLPSWNTGDFFPILLPREVYNSGKSNYIYYLNETNSVNAVDIFDERCDNYNALIIGGSGSGKSFLANSILWQYKPYNPQIAIIDYGGAGAGSYRNFVINCNGTYLEVDLDNTEFSINPFDGTLFESDFENGNAFKLDPATNQPSLCRQKYTSLLATIERMILSRDTTRKLSDLELSALDKCLRQYYLDNENNRNNDLTINDFANKMLKGHKLLNNCFEALFMFIGEGVDAGPYAHFFKKTASFRNTDLICFDLAGLGSHAQLKSVFIPALLDLISTNILSQSDFSRRKLIVCDEAWRDLQGGDMQSFMQEMSRTIRKLNGSISIISQSLADIFDSAIGGALLTNTSYFWLVGSKHEFKYLTQLKASSSKGENVLTEYEATRIVQQTSQRDTWLLSPFYNGQLRLKPSKEFVMVSTTNPKHKQILQKHMERLGHKFVTPEVIQAAKEEF